MTSLPPRRRRLGAVVFAVASLTLVSGCAARKGSFSGRFVKPGEPTVSFDDAVAAPKPASLAEYARRLRAVQANARTNLSLGETIESRNPLLAAALLKVSIAPTAENHRFVAEAYRNAGVNDYAYKHFRRALQLQPCDGSALEGLARIWRDWGAPDLALGDAHRAVYCRPASASAYNTLGTVFAALGQVNNARSAFEFALRLDAGATFALNNLCYVALQEGDGPGAQQACERALTVDPSMRAAQTNLALAYALQGEPAKAEARLLDSPDGATALFNVGMLRMSLSQYGEAAAAFELAATARPSLAEAARRAVQARAKTAAVKEQ